MDNTNKMWEYETTETGIKLFGCNEEGENIVIPEAIEGKPVETLYFALVSSDVKTIFIPKTVKEIIMWGYPISIEEIIVDKQNAWFSSREGVLYSKDLSILVRFPCAKDFNNTFLDGVVEIAPLAFADVQNITFAKLPDSVCKIGEQAFDSCENLRTVTMSDNVTEIGPGAFCCTPLEKVTLSKNVHEFEVSDFDYEGAGFFEGCHFKEFNVPEHIEKIGDRTFSGNRLLEKIYIPSTVKSIGRHVFSDCESLEEIIVAEDNEHYYSKNGVLYSRDGILLHYPRNKKDSFFELPDDIKKIGEYAFYENRNLKHLKLGDNISKIGYRAFMMSHIESINIPMNVHNIEKDVFLYTAVKELYIPNTVQYIEMNSGTAGNINPYKDIKVLVDKGSYAEKMCIEYKLKYSTVDD